MQIHISRDGQSYGPYTPAQVSQILQNGELTSSDSVWIQSLEWEAVSALPGLFSTRFDGPNGNAASAIQSDTMNQSLKHNSILRVPGLSSSQSSNYRVRPAIGSDSEGSENL